MVFIVVCLKVSMVFGVFLSIFLWFLIVFFFFEWF